MHRALASIALVATLAAVVVGAVNAAPGPAPSRPGGAAALAPGVGGQMYLDGAGDVRVSGNFLAFGDVGGMAVRVQDRAGDGLVQLGGRSLMAPMRGLRGARAPRTVVLAASPKEMVRIEGRRMSATFRGSGNVTLSITGTGSVHLDGVGTFRMNSGPARGWPLMPIDIPLRQTPAGGRG